MKKKRCLKNFLICLLISALVLQPAIFSSSMQFISIAAEAAESEKQDDNADKEKKEEEERRKKEEEEKKKEEEQRKKEEEERKKEEEKNSVAEEEKKEEKEEDKNTEDTSSDNEKPSSDDKTDSQTPDEDNKSDEDKDQADGQNEAGDSNVNPDSDQNQDQAVEETDKSNDDSDKKDDSSENGSSSSDEKKSDDEKHSEKDKDAEEHKSDDADQKEDQQNPEKDEAGTDKTEVSDKPQEDSKDQESVKDPANAAGESEAGEIIEEPTAADKLKEGIENLLGIPGLFGANDAKAKKPSLKIIVTFSPVEKEYNGQNQTISGGNFSVSYEVDGQSASVSGISVSLKKSPSVTGKDVGEYSFDFGDHAKTYFNVSGIDHSKYQFDNGLPHKHFEAKGNILKITPRGLTVTTGSAEKVWDGEPLTNPDATIDGLVAGETADITATGSQTDIGSSPNTYSIEWGTAKSSNYKITTENLGTLTVLDPTKTYISVSGADSEVTYDGDEHTGDTEYSFTDLKDGDTATITYTPAKGTKKGTYEGSFDESSLSVKNSHGTDVTELYVLRSATPGKLTINPLGIKIITGDGEKVYDGSPLTNEDDLSVSTVGDAPKGITPFNNAIDVVVTGSQTDVGESKNKYKLEIKEGYDESVLDNFEIQDQLGLLKVTPAPLSVSTGSAEKKYDGTPLTNKEAKVTGFVAGEEDTITATGSQTDVGESKNNYMIDWSKAKESNYEVKEEELGTLKVTENDTPITLKAASDSKTYDGKALTNSTVTSDDLPDGFTIDAQTTGSQTDVGSADNEIADGYAIKDSEGKDVTAFFTSITTEKGELTVNPAALTITTGSASKVYDGTPLTKTDGITVEGLAENESVTVTATGSQTEIGSSDNTYSIEWDNAKESNYTVTDKLGTLTVTEAPTNAHLTVEKVTTSKAPKDGYAVGDTIEYKITVTNDGNIPVTDIVVTDELTGDEWKVDSLEPGKSKEYTASYTVTEADAEAKEVVNVATATGKSTDPDHPDVPATDGTATDPVAPIEPVPSTYEIRYKLNGGTYDGSTDDIVEEYPEGTVISIHDAPERDGYTFDYWKGSEYQPGDQYTVTGDHVFEAQWKKADDKKKHSSHDDDDDDDGHHHRKSAPTGDNSNAALWIALVLLAALGVVGTIIYRRRNRK